MKISIADHFFLGGPMNLRGFAMRGCGPQVEGNAIGADFYWASALHVYTPLPFKPSIFGDIFRLHGFINGGTLTNISFNSSKELQPNENNVSKINDVEITKIKSCFVFRRKLCGPLENNHTKRSMCHWVWSGNEIRQYCKSRIEFCFPHFVPQQ